MNTMNTLSLCLILPFAVLTVCRAADARFIHQDDQAALLADRLEVKGRTMTLEDLGDPAPKNPITLTGATPLTGALWRVAVKNIEDSLVTSAGHRYFAAGAGWGIRVYTRDIAYSGVLGLNRLYPEEMLDSMKATRVVRRRMAFRVSNEEHRVPEIKAPWQVDGIDEKPFMAEYHTNSYSRRTDDVIWLWCTEDLLQGDEKTTREDWEWLYGEGQWFFENMYAPFFDPADGVYWGQASFMDIGGDGYPMREDPAFQSKSDCVMVKALSTNSFYVMGLDVMARTADRLGKPDEAEIWRAKAGALKAAIVETLGLPDGSLACYKDKLGKVHERRDALGTALAVLSGVVEGEAARQAIDPYPIHSWGVPTFSPYFKHGEGIHKKEYHNNTSWPFVTELFMQALQQATGEDNTARTALMHARAVRFGGKPGFSELMKHGGHLSGATGQLWSAAAFVNLCRRAGLIPFESSAIPPPWTRP